MEKVLHMNFKHPFLTPDGKISCTECQKQYKRGSLGVHIRTAHFCQKAYKCDQCGKFFGTRSKLTNHRIVHFDERKFQCTKCDAKFKTKTQLGVHVQDLHNEGSEEICPHCGSTFKSKRYLNAHIKYKHTEHARVYCDKCGKGFKHKLILDVHMKKSHEKTYVSCDDCGKVYESQAKLNVHIKAAHQKEKPFICPYEGCKRDFKWTHNLKTHIQTVHDKIPLEEKLICPFCMKRFEDKNTLKTHKNTAHPNSIKCEQCDYTSNFSQNMKIHIESDHLGISYDCDHPGCTKSFNRKLGLNQHKRDVHNVPINKLSSRDYS